MLTAILCLLGVAFIAGALAIVAAAIIAADPADVDAWRFWRGQ